MLALQFSDVKGSRGAQAHAYGAESWIRSEGGMRSMLIVISFFAVCIISRAGMSMNDDVCYWLVGCQRLPSALCLLAARSYQFFCRYFIIEIWLRGKILHIVCIVCALVFPAVALDQHTCAQWCLRYIVVVWTVARNRIDTLSEVKCAKQKKNYKLCVRIVQRKNFMTNDPNCAMN